MAETIRNGSGSYAEVENGSKVRQNGGLVRVRATIVGVTPLMMNAMGQEQILALWTKDKTAKTAARPQPREEADRKVHRLANGNPCIPVRCLYAALINAGQFIRLDGKRQISTEKKTVLPGMLTIEDFELPLLNVAGEPAAYEVDIQQGRNPNGGEAVCLIRPRFDDWRLEVTLEIDQGTMPLPMARDLVDVAGRRIGLLEFRPQRKGTFGRFNVNEWRVEPVGRVQR